MCVPQRLLILSLIALAAWGMALIPNLVMPAVVRSADEFFYDSFYRTRPVTSRVNGNVVIISADEPSLQLVGQELGYGWPWPREVWGHIAQFADSGGPRAIVFDIVFPDKSVYDNATGDDEAFGEIIKTLEAPVIFGNNVLNDGTWDRFAPKVEQPEFGAVNIGNVHTYRRYPTSVHGRPSLARIATDTTSPADDFLLHYYGPHRADGQTTFRYLMAAAVLAAVNQPDQASPELKPELFKDKIVLLGSTATGTYDQKSSPLSDVYPGTEVHATAIENLLAGQFVQPVGRGMQYFVGFTGAIITALGVGLPRRAWLKAIVPLLIVIALLGGAVGLFNGAVITWLPPVTPLLAVVLSGLGAFAWSYFAEDRQRRFMLKALSKVVSPAVAQELSDHPEKLSVGAQRREMTVMFSDLAGFTDLSESLDVDALAKVLNRYLQEMSDCVLHHNGTLDKYIGDAIMSFWNAPLDQAQHAALACRAALAIARREGELREELKSLGASHIFTRIGINTGPMAVGFTGSSHLMNYTVLGDSVNLASRLEGANKLYGSRILLSENTASLVRDKFVLRMVDVLRVKGKRQPMAVYELLDDRRHGLTDGADADAMEQKISAYERAFALYQKQQWDESESLLVEMRTRFGEDAPAVALQRRIAALRSAPPPPDWDGVYDAKDK